MTTAQNLMIGLNALSILVAFIAVLIVVGFAVGYLTRFLMFRMGVAVFGALALGALVVRGIYLIWQLRVLV